MAKQKQVSFVKNLKELTKEPKTVKFEDIEFEVKNYLPIIDKMAIIKLCLDNSIDEDKKFDSAMLDMVFNYSLAKYYTNLKIEDDVPKMYDLLESTGLMDCILQNIPIKEIEFLEECIESGLEEEFLAIERENTFVNIVKKFLEDMNNSVPEMVKALEEFDPEKLSMIKGMLDFEKGALNKKVKN